jgi:alpha-L-fucosidase
MPTCSPHLDAARECDALHANLDWFNHARFGMFVHWGPYSVAARGEWVMNRERIGLDDYTRLYVDRFTADAYDPAAWASLAKDAGMGYVVLTTRHHDGFALWPTHTRDFHAGRLGPKRDLVGPFVQAVRNAGLRVGLYYSGADWTHPDYPGAFERDWPQRWHDEHARQRFVSYYRAQLRELLTSYGDIDMLWYDGCIPQPLDGDETNAMVRQLQPNILINSRLGPADFDNSEQAIRPAPPGRAWEACMTLNGNWGYHAGDHQWKSPAEVVRMLVETARGAGNLLLNIGPRGDGSVPQPSIDILRQVGQWLQRHGEFLPHSARSPFTWNNSAMVTTRGSTVYLHLFNPPGRSLCYAEIANRVRAVRLVHCNTPIPFRQQPPHLWIDSLPAKPDPIATTIAIEVEGDPQPISPQTTFWIPGE